MLDSSVRNGFIDIDLIIVTNICIDWCAQRTWRVPISGQRRVCELVHSGVDEGVTLMLDGRDLQVLGYKKSNFVGTIIYI